MIVKKYSRLVLLAFILLSGVETIALAQPKALVYPQKQILFETNSGYQDLTSTKKTTFVTYKIPQNRIHDDFFENRRMITEEFMAGVNFSSEGAVLVLEQFWNGIKVQQCIVTPSLTGAPKFAANQNRPLDIRTQVRRESGTLSASTLRNHSYWQTDYEQTTFFGRGDEYSWGNTVVDLSVEIVVEWKYNWSVENCHFYFDHLKVEY